MGTTVEGAVAAAAEIGDDEVVIKAQILAGGRGLGTFKSGLQGGVHIIKTSEVAEYAEKMLGGTLATAPWSRSIPSRRTQRGTSSPPTRRSASTTTPPSARRMSSPSETSHKRTRAKWPRGNGT